MGRWIYKFQLSGSQYVIVNQTESLACAVNVVCWEPYSRRPKSLGPVCAGTCGVSQDFCPRLFIQSSLSPSSFRTDNKTHTHTLQRNNVDIVGRKTGNLFWVEIMWDLREGGGGSCLWQHHASVDSPVLQQAKGAAPSGPPPSQLPQETLPLTLP